MTLTRIPSTLSNVRDDVRAAIGQAAQTTGINFSYLLAQAKSESGLNPTAKSSNSSATGLYQFLDQSWLGVVKQHGAQFGFGWAADAISARKGGGYTVDPQVRDAVFALRQQAGPASMMAAAYASDNAANLSQALGRDVNGTDLYMAHFLGRSGATKFLRAQCANGSTCAAALFPHEARANRSIFYGKDGSPRSLDQVYAVMGRKLDNAVDGSDAETVDSGQGLVPGSLVSSLPGAPDLSSVQLAYGDMSSDQSASMESQDAGADISQTLAAMGQHRMNMLRPTPAQAKLAYLMLSLPSVS